MGNSPISSATRFTELEKPSQEPSFKKPDKMPGLAGFGDKKESLSNSSKPESGFISPEDELKVMVSYVPDFVAKLRLKLVKSGLNPEKLPIEAVRSAFNFQMRRDANARMSVKEFEAYQSGNSGSSRAKDTKNV